MSKRKASMASEAPEKVTENAKKENQEKKKREKEYFNYWSSIPHDILQLIAEKLSFVDCLSMSKVCMSWNAILGEELPSTQRHGLPCLLVSGLGNNGTKTCISVLENRVWELKLPESCGKYCWGSFCDWLIMVNILFEVIVKVKLLNPFSGSQIDLPPLCNDYHKMVLSGLPSEKNFICMLVHRRIFELAFWLRGAKSWTTYFQPSQLCQDAVFCNGSFYFLDEGLDILQIDVRSIYSAIKDGIVFALKPRRYNVRGPYFFQILLNQRRTKKYFAYLVESVGKLLLVLRYFNLKRNKWIDTKKFEVYACDFEELRWKMVEDLGDQMIFLGKCCSTSFSVKEVGVGIRNSIYFCNDPVDPWANEWDFSHAKRKRKRSGLNRTDVNNWGIFTFGNKDHEPFFFRGDRNTWTDTWFTAPSWWCCRNIPPIKRK